jgi:hypothetical protein
MKHSFRRRARLAVVGALVVASSVAFVGSAPAAHAAGNTVTITDGWTIGTCQATKVGNVVTVTGNVRTPSPLDGGRVQCTLQGRAWSTAVQPFLVPWVDGTWIHSETATAFANVTGAISVCIHVDMSYFDLSPINYGFDAVKCS